MATSQPRLQRGHCRVSKLTFVSRSSLGKAFPEHGIPEDNRALRVDYFLYDLGSRLPAPIDLLEPVADEDPEKADLLDVARGTKQRGIA